LDTKELSIRIEGLRRLSASQAEERTAAARDIGTLEHDRKSYNEGLLYLRALADQLKDKVKNRFEKVMTAAVQALLKDEHTSVHILQDFKRGRVTNELRIRSMINGQMTDLDPMTSEAGAMIDLLSFVIRVCLLLMNGSRFLVVDEPFKMVSSKYIPDVGEFLRTLVDKLDMDIIIVTHKRQLEDYADFAYELKDGKMRLIRKESE